jgi:tRNA threonylcarbamoyladenosine biosynthesis protein TsaE
MSSPTSAATSTASPGATEDLACRIAPLLQAGDVVHLVGELGAGKTCFVRGLARGLTSPDRVTSPTFVLVNQYRGRDTLFHVDLYRTGGAGIDDLGLWQDAESGVLVIEWADLALAAVPPPTLTVTLTEGESATTRAVALEAGSERGRTILASAGLA